MLRSHAISLAILSSVLSSLAWIFQGAAVNELTPLAVASARGIIAGALIVLCTSAMLARDRGEPPSGTVPLDNGNKAK